MHPLCKTIKHSYSNQWQSLRPLVTVSIYSNSVGAWKCHNLSNRVSFFTEISKNTLDILFQFEAYHMINNRLRFVIFMSQNIRQRSTDVKCPRRSSETVRSSQALDWSTPQCQTHKLQPVMPCVVWSLFGSSLSRASILFSLFLCLKK